MSIPEDAICIRQIPFAVVDLYPQVDDSGAATVNTTPRPGASAVTTPPQKARPESKTPTLVQAATDPKTAAHQAETACDILEDARISYAEINPDTATPDRLYGARLRLETAQASADAAVADNLKKQTALDARNKDILKSADTEMKALADKVRNNPKPADPRDEKKLAALQHKLDVALEASEQSGRSLAVARSLQGIANDLKVGRAELAGETRLVDAEDAENKLYNVLGMPNLVSGTSEIGPRIEKARQAASTNRAEWKALNDNAIKSGDAGLKARSAAGLDRAERALEYVNSSDYTTSFYLTKPERAELAGKR